MSMSQDAGTTLVITCFHGIISKNILNTDALKILTDRGWKVVVFVPQNKVELFRKYYALPRVTFEGVEIDEMVKSRINSAFLNVARLLVDSHYLWYKKKERQKADLSFRNTLKYYFELAVTKIFSRSSLAHRAFRWIDYRINNFPPLKACLIKYRPTALFTSDVFEKVDAAIMAEAKRLKIPIIGMVRSWDNCWSKGLLRVIPDKLLVNNEIIKQEAVTLHNVTASTIEVVGMPQFDIFLKADTLKTREEFFQEIGADPSKKLILFSPVGAPLSHTDWQILDMLQKNLTAGRFVRDFQVLVRLHPGREMPLGQLDASRGFIFDKPGLGPGKEVEFTPHDSIRLANSLFHSDIVIWVATTLGIDAAVYNRPQIVVNFDGYEKLAYIDSVKRYHDENHMKRMLACGGVKITHSEDELVGAINMYFNHPETDNDRRALMVSEQLYKLDGAAASRLAQGIISFVLKTCGSKT